MNHLWCQWPNCESLLDPAVLQMINRMEEEYKGQKATIASNTNAEDAPPSLFSHTHTNTLVVVDFAPLITHTRSPY